MPVFFTAIKRSMIRAALHQEAVHGFVDAIDFLAQFRESRSGLGAGGLVGHQGHSSRAAFFSQCRRSLPSPFPASVALDASVAPCALTSPLRPHYRCSKDRTRPSDQMSHTPSFLEPRNQIDDPSSPVARFGADEPLMMDSGMALAPWQIAYQTYGTLNSDRTNAVLICHALTGDQHVANVSPVTGKPGWWSDHGGTRQACRYGPFLRHLRQRHRRLLRHHGPRSRQPGHRPSPTTSISRS